MTKPNYIILLLYLLVNSFCFSQQTNTQVIAKVEVVKLADVLNIKGTVSSRTELLMSLRYDMFIYRKNPETSNVAKAENSGRVVLQPNEKKSLAELKINQNTKDKVTVVILVYDSDNKLIAKDRQVILNNDEKKVTKKIINQPAKEDDYVGLRGIVVENTKTKPGRDFYIDFYSNYRLKGINGKEVVKITEQFSFGRSTIMEVSVGNTIVHRFFVQPTRDFIEQQSRIAIINVTRYFINLQRQKNYIKQY
ncbi:CsgE family curli-type amyloid fiber assembly protein [uncultured Winogradskyella sp.]|uniref:CsgE family curli-type amyloid fiber assembly protein n=1 Tax=uncultured Winogradskyella sp. TaxID=395353 RepID=UPI00261034CC|nr:CsgE family curli-type amyloid fiber assembly protein [uncultured Winogradskyella sp.]